MNTIANETVKKFEHYLHENEKAPATIGKYIADVKAFADFLNSESISKEKLVEYKRTLIEKYAPASVNAAIASINCFLKFIGLQNLCVKSLKIQRRIFTDRERDLSKDEYKRLLRAAEKKDNKRILYLMQTICATGIRVSEVKYITIEAVRCGRVQIDCKGKMRIVMIPDKLCKALAKYAKSRKIKEGPVFVTKNGKPVDRSNIWHEMKKLCKIANVSEKKVFPHNLRHLFARTYYSVQKDIVRLADILGHSSINTTRIYTMETGEIHLKQISKLGLLLC